VNKITDLDKVRDEKAPVCEYCGEKAHKGEFQCPRIKSLLINYEEESVLIRFVGSNDLPSD
jgi:tRNA(Ile2) C34 agmatinyltransferase TiaS